MLKDIIFMAGHNLLQRRLRTFLTTLGIIIGVAAIVGIISLGRSMKINIYQQLEKLGGDIITVIPGNIKAGRISLSSLGLIKLTERDLKEVSKVDGIDEVAGILRTTAKVRLGKEEIHLTINGVKNPEAWRKIESLRVGLENGRFLSKEDKYVAVIGYSVAHEIFSKEIEVGKKIEIEGVEFKVVGVLNEVGGSLAALDQYIYLPIDSLRSLFPERFGKDEFSIISAKVMKGYDVNEVAERVNEALLKLRKETEETKTFTVISPKFFEETIGNIMTTLTVFLGGIAAISLIVGGIGIMNIMYVSVMERTREIGVMKAIGATNFTILLLFILESGLIGLVGGIIGDVVGVIFSYGLGFVVSKAFALGKEVSINILISPEILLLGCFFGFVVGVLAGFFPARKAAKLQPVEALRYE